MHDIFLSYSSKDRERLVPLVSALEAEGWTVFWDHRTIKVADDWHKVIGTAIQQCTCVIVAWSERSIDSTWVREEALIARGRGVLYPIFIDQVPIPFGFTLLQAADFTGWNGDTNHQEFFGLKEQLSIRLNLQPVVNLKPEPNPPLMPEPTLEAIPTPEPKVVPTKKPETKPRPPKQTPAQPQPQKVAATGSNPKKPESNIKLLGGAIAYRNQKKIDQISQLVEKRRASYQQFVEALIATTSAEFRDLKDKDAKFEDFQRVSAVLTVIASDKVLRKLADFQLDRSKSALKLEESAVALIEAFRKDVFEGTVVSEQIIRNAFPIKFGG